MSAFEITIGRTVMLNGAEAFVSVNATSQSPECPSHGCSEPRLILTVCRRAIVFRACAGCQSEHPERQRAQRDACEARRPRGNGARGRQLLGGPGEKACLGCFYHKLQAITHEAEARGCMCLASQ